MSELYANEFELFLEWFDEHLDNEGRLDGIWRYDNDGMFYTIEEIFELFKIFMYE